MNIGNFLKEHQWEIIFALVIGIPAAILIPLFWEPIKKFLVSILNRIKRVSATKKFEQKYRDWLINRFRFLNVRGIKTNAPVAIELEKVFIPLKAKKRAYKIRYPLKRRVLSPYLERGSDQEHLLKGRVEEYETEETYELKDLFNLPQKRLIIIGAPGSGKTTLLNHLALKFARKSEKGLFGIENEFLPIFMNLRDTIKEGFLDVKNFVKNYNNYIECSDSPPQDFFKKKLNEGECIILLDGLDEVATVEQRASVAKWVDELATAYSRNIFIATSRPYGYETARLYNDFLELHILNFTPEQVEEFIRYWTKAVEIKVRENESEFTLKEAQKEADDLLKAIKENPKIEALTVNPLLLTIISLVHRYRATLPKRRVELYEECCDVLLGYWDTSKGLVGELEPRKKRTILQPLAFHLHRNGIREEKREKFIELLQNELPKIGVPKDKADDFLEDIRDRCGILVETQLGFFGFSHQTFQEFLTARYIFNTDLEDFLVTKKRDKYWLEVTLLYCGMKDTTNLLQEILKEKEDIFYTNLFLAGRCLAESLSANPELRNQITQKLFDIYWDENEFDKSQKTALEVLKGIKDQKIISKFMELLKAKESDVRGRAASALGQIQAKEAVEPLIGLLKDKESEVRWHAANALGEIQAKEAVLPLLELLKDKESYVIWRAVSALGQIQAKEALDLLLELLKDKDTDVRGSAVSALGEIQAKETLEPLLELLKKDRYVRGLVPYTLGQIQAKEAILPLMELLKDKDSVVRWNAASALGQIQAKEAVEPLLELLKDKESEVRQHAADALGEIRAKEAVLPLLELLKDKESYVRGTAADALGQIQAKEAILPLMELLKDKDSYVRGRAANTLGQIQAKEAILPLMELLKDKDSVVRWNAASALGQIQAKEAVEPLLELLKDKDSYVRWHAAEALGQIGDKKAIESLKLLLHDKEYSPLYGQVRDSAFNALKEISERNGIPIYKD